MITEDESRKFITFDEKTKLDNLYTKDQIDQQKTDVVDQPDATAIRINAEVVEVTNRDGDGAGAAANYGVVAWTPGLAGTYSGGHFARVVCDPPAGATATEASISASCG